MGKKWTTLFTKYNKKNKNGDTREGGSRAHSDDPVHNHPHHNTTNTNNKMFGSLAAKYENLTLNTSSEALPQPLVTTSPYFRIVSPNEQQEEQLTPCKGKMKHKLKQLPQQIATYVKEMGQDPVKSLHQLRQMVAILSEEPTKERTVSRGDHGPGQATRSLTSVSMSSSSSVSSSLFPKSKSERLLAKSLFYLWKFLVQRLFQAPDLDNEEKELIQECLVTLAQRKEFDAPLDDDLRHAIKIDYHPDDHFSIRSNDSNNSSGDNGSFKESFFEELSDCTEDEGAESHTLLNQYGHLLLETFSEVVNKIENSPLQKVARNVSDMQFVAKLLAVVYIRIPFIRENVLDKIECGYHQAKWTKSSDYMNEKNSAIYSKIWTERTFDTLLNELTTDPNNTPNARLSTEQKNWKEEEIRMNQFKHDNPSLFAWSDAMLSFCPTSDERWSNVQSKKWMQYLVTDGEFFFAFVASVYKHIQNVSTKPIVWSVIPGYSILTRVSLLILKDAAWRQWSDLQTFSDPLLINDGTHYFFLTKRGVKFVMTESTSLLHNLKLMNICISALYECTTVYDARSVGLCLNQFGRWFSVVAVDKGCSFVLPEEFDGGSFLIGMRILLSSEKFEVLKRVLLFLYRHMDYFDGQVRQGVLKILVQKHFGLFLNWNDDIRNYYHHILVYKIARIDRALLSSVMDKILLGNLADAHIDSYDMHEVRTYMRENRSADAKMIRHERSLWRAFDACLSLVCMQERRNARHRFEQYKIAKEEAKIRSMSFKKLNRSDPGDDGSNPASFNEGLPGGQSLHEVECIEDELKQEPPYYLRYLPLEESEGLEELSHLASKLSYSQSLQVYAARSLRNYSELLKDYYKQKAEHNRVEPPLLDFC